MSRWCCKAIPVRSVWTQNQWDRWSVVNCHAPLCSVPLCKSSPLFSSTTEESDWDSSLEIFPCSVCVTDAQSPAQKRERREELSVIDIVCVKNTLPQIPTLLSRLITSLPVMVVTMTEWLLPSYSGCCYEMNKGKKKLSWSFPVGQEKVINQRP